MRATTARSGPTRRIRLCSVPRLAEEQGGDEADQQRRDDDDPVERKKFHCAHPVASASASQASAADSGLKGTIPIARPFLDYVISALADAGITDVCLILGPEQQRVRDYFGGEVELTRIRAHFALQEKPLGTADAVAAAESFAHGEHVVALNSDNYYPVHTLRALRELGTAGVAVFERDALMRLSPRSRASLETLLRQLENHESRLPEEERFDIGRLRAALGMH